MRQQSAQESDPQEVANKVYQCATKDSPIHNVSGNNAEAVIQMKKTMSEDEFAHAAQGTR